MFQGLVGFIGPVGEAGLAGEKVIICGVFSHEFISIVFTRSR